LVRWLLRQRFREERGKGDIYSALWYPIVIAGGRSSRHDLPSETKDTDIHA